jgi:hypothetical protein
MSRALQGFALQRLSCLAPGAARFVFHMKAARFTCPSHLKAARFVFHTKAARFVFHIKAARFILDGPHTVDSKGSHASLARQLPRPVGTRQ